MRFINQLRILALACALLLPQLATAEPEPDKWENAVIENRRSTKEAELKELKRQRETLLNKNQPTDTLDLAIQLVREELDLLATGKLETKEERLKRDLSTYKRLRAHYVEQGQSTAGIAQMIANTQRQLKGGPVVPTPGPNSQPKPSTPHGEKLRQTKIESHERAISSLQKTVDHYQDSGRPVPQGLQDMLEKKKAQLAELKK